MVTLAKTNNPHLYSRGVDLHIVAQQVESSSSRHSYRGHDDDDDESQRLWEPRLRQKKERSSKIVVASGEWRL